MIVTEYVIIGPLGSIEAGSVIDEGEIVTKSRITEEGTYLIKVRVRELPDGPVIMAYNWPPDPVC